MRNVQWSRASVCVSAAACPHYCKDPDVTWRNYRGCPLVVHHWADLQSVHGLRCYGNSANAKCQRVRVLALCLVCIKVGLHVTPRAPYMATLIITWMRSSFHVTTTGYQSEFVRGYVNGELLAVCICFIVELSMIVVYSLFLRCFCCLLFSCDCHQNARPILLPLLLLTILPYGVLYISL